MSACIFTFSHIFAKQVPNHLTHYNSRKASGVCKLGRWHLLGLMPQVVVLGSVDSGWINIPTTQTSWKHGHSAAKSIHFLILHVDWLLTAVFCFGASYAGGRRRTDARTPFFFTQVVWLEPACSQHCEPARILWWSCWCLILDIPNGQIKKITNRVRSEFPPLKKSDQATGVFFTSTRARMGVFCYQLPRFFFTRVEATKHAIAQIEVIYWEWLWHGYGHGNKMLKACSCSYGSTKEGIVFHASIFQVLFSSSLVTQL